MSTSNLFEMGTWLAALLSGGAGGAVLYFAAARRRGAETQAVVGLRQLLLATVAASACVGATFVVFVTAGSNVFGLIRVAYLAVAVVPPLIGLFLLALIARRKTVRVPRRSQAAAILLLAPLPVCAYASFVAPYDLRIERTDVAVAGLNAAEPSIRILVLADLQTDRVRAYERDVIAQGLSEQPDLILLPGDIFQGSQQQFEAQLAPLRGLLSQLVAPGGAFACRGNVDRPQRLRSLFEGTPVRYLDNDIALVEIRGRTLAIAGVDWQYESAEAQRTYRRLGQVEADVRILLGHTPDCAIPARPEDRIDLIVAGHTHGGQVVIPGVGPLLTLTRVPRRIGAGGLHEVGGQKIYVSRGVGFERGSAPPVRLFCPPELSVLTLRGTQ